MKDTSEIRNKMIGLWRKFDQKKITHQEARIHIGMARAILETHKVEIAAAHLELSQISPVSNGVAEFIAPKAKQRRLSA